VFLNLFLLARERQQQLDELTKELTRVSEECDMLRMRLKAVSKSNKAVRIIKNTLCIN
jgi:prefoldin subunit 5